MELNGREGATPAHDNQKLFYDNSMCVNLTKIISFLKSEQNVSKSSTIYF